MSRYTFVGVMAGAAVLLGGCGLPAMAVTVTSQGKVLYKGRIARSIGTLARTLAERGDPASVFSGEIVVTLTEKTK